MRTVSLSEFEQLDKLLEEPNRCVYRAVDRTRQIPVRLTVISREMSQLVDFRRSMKTDLAMLQSLQHHAVPRFLGAGECDDGIILWSEDAQADDLHNVLQSGRSLSAEDVIEIGWQVCSALQHAHNFGLSHGGLTERSILISSDLRVYVVDFGVARWLDPTRRPADGSGTTVVVSSLSTVTHWRQEVSTDLKSLASVLQTTVRVAEPRAVPRVNGSVSFGSLLRLLDRIQQYDESTHPVSARDIQGRLGELLIGTEDDQIDLVDQRGQSYRSSRSIVDELFDTARPATETASSNTAAKPATTPADTHKLLVLVSVLVILLLLLFAAVLR